MQCEAEAKSGSGARTQMAGVCRSNTHKFLPGIVRRENRVMLPLRLARIGVVYDDARGVPQDHTEAASWHFKGGRFGLCPSPGGTQGTVKQWPRSASVP